MKIKRTRTLWMGMTLLLALAMGCQPPSNQNRNRGYGCADTSDSTATLSEENPAIGKGIYYWKTIFSLTDYEKDFLKQHDVRRLYLRLFDVDYTLDRDGSYRSIPIATTLFHTPVPEEMEIVPVVYITTKAIKTDPHFSAELYERIQAMAKRNHFPKIKEIQLDCDWTQNTRQAFFQLCREMGNRAHAEDIALSATIRLHQLKDAAPPVDRGVLMLYNTGSLYDAGTENSILHPKDVAPYLKGEISYSVPLSTAFPTYSWSILLKGNRFEAILHTTDFGDTSRYQKIDDHQYRVIKDHYLENHEMKKGMVVRLESPRTDDILKVKKEVTEHLQQSPLSSIVYHLDSAQLSRFTKKEIDQILK